MPSREDKIEKLTRAISAKRKQIGVPKVDPELLQKVKDRLNKKKAQGKPPGKSEEQKKKEPGPPQKGKRIDFTA